MAIRNLAPRDEGGYSFLWVMFAVAALAMSMALAGIVWSTDVRRQKERELIFVGRQFADAIGRYYESTPGAAKEYPPSLDALVADPRFPGVRRHLRRIYADPISGTTQWGKVIVANRIVGVYSESTAEPLKIGNFEPAQALFADSKKYSQWLFTYPTDLTLVASPGGLMLPPGSQPIGGAPPASARNN